ncbi:MAG: hypothetical protein Q4C56_00420 [Peptococcaceae bacterium]|nr:hypothetical protein [Peptococcaceae bacterium]
MNNDNVQASLIQNLRDADCSQQTIDDFLAFDGNTKAQLKLLANHRQQLLDLIHKQERCITCLDYLVCQMNKQAQAAPRS